MMVNNQPTFERNGFYEKIIALRKSQPKAFESLSPATKMSLAQYETQKCEAARLQAIRDEASGTGAAQ